MIGTWRLRCGLRGQVDAVVGELLFGFVFIHTSTLEASVPTYWNKNGNSVTHDFDLMEKVRGPEYFEERRG